MGTDNNIFREKSIEQLSSPEQLTGYLRVTGPGVWFVLAGVIILLGGMLVWGIFGRILKTVTAPALVKDGEAYCYVLTEDVNLNSDDIEVRIGDVSMPADPQKASTITLDASADPALYASGYLSPGEGVVILACSTDLKDGNYNAVVTTEYLKPISLLFSQN